MAQNVKLIRFAAKHLPRGPHCALRIQRANCGVGQLLPPPEVHRALVIEPGWSTAGLVKAAGATPAQDIDKEAVPGLGQVAISWGINTLPAALLVHLPGVCVCVCERERERGGEVGVVLVGSA